MIWMLALVVLLAFLGFVVIPMLLIRSFDRCIKGYGNGLLTICRDVVKEAPSKKAALAVIERLIETEKKLSG